MKTKKFTFKKEPRETGLRSVGHPYQDVNVKLDGEVVGMIHAPYWQTPDHKWSVQFAVEVSSPENPSCPWKWIALKKRFDSEQEARDFLQEHCAKLCEAYKLFPFEKD